MVRLIIMGNEATPGEDWGKVPSTAAGGSQENEELCWESQTTTGLQRSAQSRGFCPQRAVPLKIKEGELVLLRTLPWLPTATGEN